MLETNQIIKTENYSVDMMTRSVFDYELRNNLHTVPLEYRDETWCAVEEYLKERLSEIEKRYKSK